MKTKFILLFLLQTFILISQINVLPDNVAETHYLLKGFYENTLTKSERDSVSINLVAKTKFLQDSYESITEYYRYFNAEKKILKGVRVYTDNDLFTFFDNRDHEYTGGLRVELITDYFGLKILSFKRDHLYLTYQAVFFGFELYTPDVLNVQDIGDLNPLDRPFASFQYVGRSRNVIRYDGTYRSSGEFKIGIMGGDVSRNFQRIIHRDISDSENNNGWDYQIANGGRFAFQYNNSHEWMYKVKNRNLYLNYGFNFGVGWEKNFLAPTISLTNKSFFQRNPHNAISSHSTFFGTQKWWKQIKETAFYEIKLQPEYVMYNSMLQGYLTKNEEFIFDQGTKVNIPVIEDIYPVVGRLSVAVGFRNYNSNLMFEYVIQTPEYDYSWKDKYFHKYARISFTMNL